MPIGEMLTYVMSNSPTGRRLPEKLYKMSYLNRAPRFVFLEEILYGRTSPNEIGYDRSGRNEFGYSSQQQKQ
jgi:hypothetical protein